MPAALCRAICADSALQCWLPFAGSNVVSVAEHVVMQILALVRNYMPAYHQVCLGLCLSSDVVQLSPNCC